MKKIVLFILLSISIFSEPYEIKNNKVYYYERLLENSDAESFKYLDSGYAQDKNNVYFYGRKIEGADSQSFKIYKKIKKVNSIDYDSADKNNYYYEGEVVKKRKNSLK